MIINKGFSPKHTSEHSLPPGQYETHDFPVLSKGYTPKIDTNNWKIRIHGLVSNPIVLSWNEFNALPSSEITTDIHCVTKWSKFNTVWKGVSLDTLVELVGLQGRATHVLAFTYDDYSTNLPVADILLNKAYIVTEFDQKPLASEHGGPARLLVPHLYLWKSAKWINELKFIDHEELGFWELRGYHRYGDPWKQQRYDSDE